MEIESEKGENLQKTTNKVIEKIKNHSVMSYESVSQGKIYWLLFLKNEYSFLRVLSGSDFPLSPLFCPESRDKIDFLPTWKLGILFDWSLLFGHKFMRICLWAF